MVDSKKQTVPIIISLVIVGAIMGIKMLIGNSIFHFIKEMFFS